jgi:hypothetical protein
MHDALAAEILAFDAEPLHFSLEHIGLSTALGFSFLAEKFFFLSLFGLSLKLPAEPREGGKAACAFRFFHFF